MATLRTIKKRIRSVRNTKQMSRAMEAVAANKMRRAQAVAIAARPYAKKALEILSELEARGAQLSDAHALLHRFEEGKTLVVVIVSDKGLCGALNASVLSLVSKRFGQMPDAEYIALGNYGAQWLTKGGSTVVEARKGIGEVARIEDARPVTEALVQRYAGGAYKAVYVAYSNFISVLRQEPVVRSLLPLTKEAILEIVGGIGGMKSVRRGVPVREERMNGTLWNYEYQFEPEKQELLNELVPRLAEASMYHMILEANASEHSARMVAMKNASDNASDLLKSLTRTYNKARQASITRELTEITAGKEALSENI